MPHTTHVEWKVRSERARLPQAARAIIENLLLWVACEAVLLKGDCLCAGGEQQVAELVRSSARPLVRPVCCQCSHLHPVATWIRAVESCERWWLVMHQLALVMMPRLECAPWQGPPCIGLSRSMTCRPTRATWCTSKRALTTLIIVCRVKSHRSVTRAPGTQCHPPSPRLDVACCLHEHSAATVGGHPPAVERYRRANSCVASSLCVAPNEYKPNSCICGRAGLGAIGNASICGRPSGLRATATATRQFTAAYVWFRRRWHAR